MGSESEMEKRWPDWERKSKAEKLASVLYPDLAGQRSQQQMQEIARAFGRKPPQQQALLADKDRGAVSPLGGTAKR